MVGETAQGRRRKRRVAIAIAAQAPRAMSPITLTLGVPTVAIMMQSRAPNVPAVLLGITSGRPGATAIANGRVENAWRSRDSCATLHIAAADQGEKAMPRLLRVHRGPSWETAIRQGSNSIDI